MPIYTSIRSAFDGLSGSWPDMPSGDPQGPRIVKTLWSRIAPALQLLAAHYGTDRGGLSQNIRLNGLAMRAARFVSQRVHHESVAGTFETCRSTMKMSASGGRPEV